MIPHPVRRRARGTLLLVVAFWSSGCFVYQDVGQLPDEGSLPADVRVFRSDGPIIEFFRSRVAADTIRGFRIGDTTAVLIPLAQVDSVQYKYLQRRKSAVAAVVTVGAAVGFVLAFRTIWLRGRPPSIPPGF